MTAKEIREGVILDDVSLSLYEFASACRIEPTWVIERVQDGVLGNLTGPLEDWRFTSTELLRAQRLIATEKTFDASAELAALVVDLIEELGKARRLLKTAGIS